MAGLFNTTPAGANLYPSGPTPGVAVPSFLTSAPAPAAWEVELFAAPAYAPTALDIQQAQLELQSLQAEISRLLVTMGPTGVTMTAPTGVAPSPVGAFYTVQASLSDDLQRLFNKAKKAIDRLFASIPGPVVQPPVSQPPVSQPPASQPPASQPHPTGPRRTTEFVISSFNVLGSSHTIPGKSERPGMASGVQRIRGAVQLLDKHKVDVVGFQEFQPDQVKEFQRLAGDQYAVYPGMKLGRGPNVNSLAWRKDTWDLVKADTIPIPYFDGKLVKMPVVRLRNKETGQEAYFANFHNPASTKKQGNHEHWRDVATDKEIALVNRLMRETGLPVFVTGDMNEREEYYDRMTRGAAMVSADAPRGNRPSPKKMAIDWIFGSKGVTFSDYVRDRGPLVKKTSDHPIVVSKAKIQGS